MRILHLNNVANVPMVLAEEQRLRGHEAKVLDLHPHPYGFKNDGQLSVLERLRLPFEAFDVFHLHSCSMWPFYLDSNLQPVMRGKKIIYHHHGSDVRYGGCPVPKFRGPHLVSRPELERWCPNALYVPNPVENATWREKNAEFMPIQRIRNQKQAAFLDELKATSSKRKLYDLQNEMLGFPSLSAIQAEGLGLHVSMEVPCPNEVSHVVDVLDYVYTRMA